MARDTSQRRRRKSSVMVVLTDATASWRRVQVKHARAFRTATTTILQASSRPPLMSEPNRPLSFKEDAGSF